VALKEVHALRDLKPGNWIRVKDTVTAWSCVSPHF
jgi:hypothetical protein